jgi:hypothetical protein
MVFMARRRATDEPLQFPQPLRDRTGAEVAHRLHEAVGMSPHSAPSLQLYEFNRNDTAVVTVHDASCCLREPSWLDRMPSVVVGAGVLSSMVTITALGACLPLKLLWVLGAAFAVLVVFAALPARREGAWAIAPSEIADLELRDGYRALLAAHTELANAAAQHGPSPITRALLDQSRDLVISNGRSVRATNAGTRYLAAHGTDTVAGQAAEAHDHAHATGDDAARAHWAAVDDARQRQLATMQELRGQRDRVRAELEVAVARIEVTTAELVKQHMVDAAAVCAAGSCTDHGATLEDTLDGLRSAQAALPPA